MKKKPEIVQEQKEKEKNGGSFPSTKESSKTITHLPPNQNNKSDKNLGYERFKNFFENAPICGYMISPEGMILEVNKTALACLGYKKEELLGKHFSTVYAPEYHEKIKELFSKWKETGEIDNEEMVIVTKQGEKRTVLLSINSVRDANGNILYSLSIQKDITEINRIYDELNKNLESQNIKLQQLNEVKTTFLKTTSHELRTPITSIKGYVQMLLKKKLGEISEEQRKSLEVILRNTNRLDRSIKNILDASSLKSGSMKFIPSKINPRMLVEEITKTMQSFAYEKEMTINVDLEKNLPDLMVDGGRIKQVVMNLVDNAIKFSPDGSMINIKARKENEDVLFEVQDYGQGIPRNKLKEIFDGFYQVDSGEDRKFGGAGIGLAISKGIIQSHGGNIWVESAEGKGSTFCFTLPIKQMYDIENIDFKNEISQDMHGRGVYFVADTLTRNTTGKYINHPTTEHEKTTDAVKESEERYRALFDSSFELIYVHDFKGNFIDANPAALKLLGYSKEELRSLNFSSLLDKSQLWKAIKTLREIKEYDRQKEPMEYRLKTKNGALVDIETTAKILYRNGKPYAVQGIAHDITKRKKVKQSIKESEEKFRTIFDSATDGILIADMENKKFFTGNNAICTMLGYSIEEIKNLGVMEIHPKEDLPFVVEQFEKQARREIVSAENIPLKRKDGSVFYADINSSPITLSGKTYLMGFFRDITKRKNAEDALRESQERFRSLVETTSAWIWEVDKNGVYTYVSPKVKDLLGYTPEEVIGKTPFDFMPAEEVKHVGEKFHAILAAKAPITALENINLHKDGRRVVLETSGVPILDTHGNLLGYRGIDHDITERKKMEQQLHESTAMYKTLVNASPEAISVFDMEGHFIYVSLQTLKLHGFEKKEELLGHSAFELIAPEEHASARDSLQQVTKNPILHDIQYTALRKDGTRFPLEGSAVVIKDQYGHPKSFITITRDITERKEIQDEIRYLKEYNENILESNPNPMMVVKGKQIEYVNKSFTSIFGETKNKYITKNLKDAIPLEIFPVFEKLLQDGDKPKELKFKDKNFSVYSFIIKKADAEEERKGIVFQDITDKKNREKELKEKIEELERYKRLTVGRELQMVELKNKCSELEEKVEGEKSA